MLPPSEQALLPPGGWWVLAGVPTLPQVIAIAARIESEETGDGGKKRPRNGPKLEAEEMLLRRGMELRGKIFGQRGMHRMVDLLTEAYKYLNRWRNAKEDRLACGCA